MLLHWELWIGDYGDYGDYGLVVVRGLNIVALVFRNYYIEVWFRGDDVGLVRWKRRFDWDKLLGFTRKFIIFWVCFFG
ncbi:hypothetical protein J6A31_05880 [bacterium]|nr:hypothetical protein [bacterium]